MSRRAFAYNKILNSEKAFLFISLSILESQGFPGLSALISVVGPNTLLKLVRLYSGGSIKIPTSRELSRGIIAALYVYHKYAEPLQEEDFLRKYKVDMNLNTLHTIVRKWEDYMKKQDVDVKTLLQSAVDV